jgi:hypothetical protein
MDCDSPFTVIKSTAQFQLANQGLGGGCEAGAVDPWDSTPPSDWFRCGLCKDVITESAGRLSQLQGHEEVKRGGNTVVS